MIDHTWIIAIAVLAGLVISVSSELGRCMALMDSHLGYNWKGHWKDRYPLVFVAMALWSLLVYVFLSGVVIAVKLFQGIEWTLCAL